MFEIFIRFITRPSPSLSLAHQGLASGFPLVEEEQDKHEIHDQPGHAQPGVQAILSLHTNTSHSVGLKQGFFLSNFCFQNFNFLTILDLPN